MFPEKVDFDSYPSDGLREILKDPDRDKNFHKYIEKFLLLNS